MLALTVCPVKVTVVPPLTVRMPLPSEVLLNVPVNLGGSLVINAAAGNLALTNVLADDANDSLTGGIIASGTNTVTLAGNNTYSGLTLINAGTVILSGNNVSAAGPVTNNATLQLDEFAASGNNPLGSGVLALANGSTLQLRSDSSAAFTPASLALPNAADTLNFDVGPVTTGVTGQTLTFDYALAFADSQANQTINVTGANGYTLALGDLSAVSATTHNPYQMVAINVIPGVTVQLGSFTTGNWGDYLSFSGGGNAVFTGTPMVWRLGELLVTLPVRVRVLLTLVMMKLPALAAKSSAATL